MRDTGKHLAMLLGLGLAGAAVVRGGALAGHSHRRSQPVALAPSTAPSRPRSQVGERYGKLPLYFIENRGQTDQRVAYYLPGRDKSLYFTAEGLTWVLHGSNAENLPRSRQDSRLPGARLLGQRRPEESAPGSAGVSPASRRPGRPRSQEAPSMLIPPPDPTRLSTIALASWHSPGMSPKPPAQQRWVLKLDFLGANPGVRPRGEQRSRATISYFRGKRAEWKTGLKTYTRVVYSNLWPGIDLVYSGNAGQLKYTFTVRPGADPHRIRLRYRGATGMQVTPEGRLAVKTPVGGLEDAAPSAYQEVGGQQVKVAAGYALEGESRARGHHYGFRVGPYDRDRPLLIDPTVLVYAGFIGGADFDEGTGIAVDRDGNAYVVGTTESDQSTFPVTAGPDATFNGGIRGDAFVAKVNPSGTALVYCGYIGGSGRDEGHGIAVDTTGNAYVTGGTESTQSTFPAVGGPDLTFNGGISEAFASDAFVAKVNAAGTALVYCGYIGGSSGDTGTGIAVDTAGNAYVTGETSSTQSTFPVVAGPDLTFNARGDAFVAKVNPTGASLVYCGYIGGSGGDIGTGIAVDGDGNAYVTGHTSSTGSTFPVTGGPDLTYNGGISDAFVAKVNAAGTALVYCGYIGGRGLDEGRGIAVDRAGNAYVTGRTLSAQATFLRRDGFPVRDGPDLTFNGGGGAFVANANAAGEAAALADVNAV